MCEKFAVKGAVAYSASSVKIETAEEAYVVCNDGICGGVFKDLPSEYANLPVKDYGKSMIIPGLSDMHIHAPQFPFRAMGMDDELLAWLERYAFPEESKYADIDYARGAYRHFIDEILRTPVTRLCIFATVHTPATLLLADMLEESGLVCFIGKVNMDRNGPVSLCEKSARESLAATEEWLCEFERRNYKNVRPIITPRFIPSCSDELLHGLAALREKYKLPVQSHLSENRKEIAWVRELCPGSAGYAAAYYDRSLIGPGITSVMAHCVWSDDDEIRLLKENNVLVAHCPESNMNLSSGIAPVRRLLSEGVRVGLGSDVAAGCNTSIFCAMSDAVRVSKLRRAIIAPDETPLGLDEVFYMGTVAGGSFFGNTGSFEPGSEFDAVVLDDGDIEKRLPVRGRLEKAVYIPGAVRISDVYVRGKLISSERHRG